MLLVVIGTDAPTCEQAIAIASQHSDVWATVGLHPHDATQGTDSILPYVTQPRVVAIGECGLDGLVSIEQKIQEQVFKKQIEHRLAAQQRNFFDFAVVERHELACGVEYVCEYVARQALGRQQMDQLAMAVELRIAFVKHQRSSTENPN